MSLRRLAHTLAMAVALLLAATTSARAQPSSNGQSTQATAEDFQSAPAPSVAPAAQPPAAPAAPSTESPNPAPKGGGSTRPLTKSPTGIGGIGQIPGTTGQSVPWPIIVMLTTLTLLPSILLCMTPFARLLIVFHFLRQALGLQTTPSNQTLIGLSLILTFFIMQPIASQIYDASVVPMQDGKITAIEALNRASGPMRQFMSHYVREKDVALFIELAKEPRPASINDVSMRVLLPAYILSELKAGFQIGTVLFLPFLIVDMVVASITTSVGMLQLPPVVISTPLKLLLFLMVDGWHLLISSLMRSFS
jgi:flagellar biosynthetic protein FliP